MGGHGGNKRFMRRDFKTKKDNVWVPGKGRNNVKANDGFVTEGDKNNTDFNEYYQAQGAPWWLLHVAPRPLHCVAPSSANDAFAQRKFYSN